MRVPSLIKDVKESLRVVILALNNRLTVRDNFGPEGVDGQVLTSRGPDHIPEWQTPSTQTQLDDLIATLKANGTIP